MEMQDSLSQMGRLASMGEVNEAEITHFRHLISQVRALAGSPEVSHQADEIEDKFNQFVNAIGPEKNGVTWTQVKRA